MSTLSTSAEVSRRTAHYNPCVPPEDAVARYTSLLEQNAGTCLTRLQRAKAYVQLGDYAAACTDLDAWIQQNTQSTKGHSLNREAAGAMTDALFYRGVCLAQLSQVEAALEDFEEVLQSEPTRSRAMYGRAACEARLGDFSNAVAHYEAALQMDEVGKEKALLQQHHQRRERQRQRMEQQQRRHRERQQQRQREEAAAAALVQPTMADTPPLGNTCVGLNTSVQSFPTATPADVVVTAMAASAAEDSSLRSPMSLHGVVNVGGGRRSSVDVASDSVVGAVSLSEFTTPVGEQLVNANVAVGAALFMPGLSSSRHTSVDPPNVPDVDDLTGVSSSTASSPLRSFIAGSEGGAEVEEDSAATNDQAARRADPEHDLDAFSAMDPTCVLSSCSDLDMEDMVEAEREAATEVERQTRHSVGNENNSNNTSTAGPGAAVANPPTLLTAAYYYQRGLQHRRRGELRAAIKMYTKALELNPTHFKSLFNRAFSYDKLKDYDHAVADYNGAVKLDPKNAFIYYNLGISYDHKGNHSRAVRAFTRAIQLDNTRPDFFHNRGFSQRKLLKFEAAIDDYTAAITLDPNHFKSHYNRAYCYSKLNRYTEAVADYSAALRIDSRNANAYHNRGVALEKLGRLEEALEDFTRALQRDPELTFSLNARGLLYDQLQRYDKALADFTRAIELDKHNPAWLHNRGYTYRNMGQLELAIEDYTASIKLAPHSYTAYNNRAFAYRKLGRYEEAIADYTVVLREQPSATVKALNNRAYCFARLELFDDAIRDYSEVLATDAANTHAFYNRGISYEKCAKYNAAIDDFTRVIQLAPEATGSANAYYSRGTSRLQLNQVPQARADLKQALKLDSMASGLRGYALKAFQAQHPAGQLLHDLGAT